MKRIVFSTVGSLGDLHPYIAIGRVLLALGHQPVIATTDRYRALIEAQGIEYAPLRPAEAQFGGLKAVAARLFDPLRGPAYLIRKLVMPHVREQYADIAAACAGAHLLVTHPLSVAGPLFCGKTRLPWASGVLAPISLMSCADPPLIAASALARLARRLGPGLAAGAWRLPPCSCAAGRRRWTRCAPNSVCRAQHARRFCRGSFRRC